MLEAFLEPLLLDQFIKKTSTYLKILKAKFLAVFLKKIVCSDIFLKLLTRNKKGLSSVSPQLYMKKKTI